MIRFGRRQQLALILWLKMLGPAILQLSWPFFPRYKMMTTAAELAFMFEAERRNKGFAS